MCIRELSHTASHLISKSETTRELGGEFHKSSVSRKCFLKVIWDQTSYYHSSKIVLDMTTEAQVHINNFSFLYKLVNFLFAWNNFYTPSDLNTTSILN